MSALFILFVKDQKRSTNFYRKVLIKEPTLEVPGMSEFSLGPSTTLGLMPESGIKKLLNEKLPDPEKTNGVSRSELCLRVEDPEEFHLRSLENGGVELSSLQSRDWGDDVAYSKDLDGHILAFAVKSF